MNTDQTELAEFLLPYATAAIGSQHPWLIAWAISKSIQESGSKRNILIISANNCLGIKAVTGTPSFGADDSTADGRDDGAVMWRKFGSLTECFAELVKMWNTRSFYQPARNLFVTGFENIYADGMKEHTISVLNKIHEVQDWLQNREGSHERGRAIA